MILRNLSYPILIETLNKYTRKFIRYLLEGGHQKDLEQCKKILDSLLNELRSRRKQNNFTEERETAGDDTITYVLSIINNKAIQN